MANDEPADQQCGAFDDFEPFDVGETNAAKDHDTEFVDYPE